MSAIGKCKSALLYGAALLISAPVFANGLLVIKGPNSPPYREALSGFQQSYPGGVEIGSAKREIARRVQSNSPTLIVAFGREAAEAAREQAPGIPLIFALVANPGGSLTGQNVGGISTQLPGDLQLTRFKELLPDLKSIALLHNPSWSGTMVADAEEAAKRLGLHLEDVPVSSPNELRNRFNLVKPIVSAIWVVPDEFTTPNSVWEFLRVETGRMNLPLLFTNGEQAVADGALASLIPDYRAIGRQCGELVQQVASGKMLIADVKIRQPQGARWTVNTKTARRLGLSIPRQILDSAKVYP